MDWEYLAVAILAAVAVSALVTGLVGVWLKGSVDRRLDAFAASAAAQLEAFRAEAARQQEAHAVRADRFADVADELINLARRATESAIRSEELNEWHRPNAAALGSDDVSEAIRGRLRRASWDTAAATSSLSAAIRRHREVIPGVLEQELAAFHDRLTSASGEGASSERKRELAGALDSLESRFRDLLGASVPAT